MFEVLAELTGFQIDQVRYLTMLAVSYPLAIIFLVVLNYRNTPSSVRHVYCTALGVLFCAICFGIQLVYMAAFTIFGYLLLLVLPMNKVHWISLAYAMVCISMAHTYRMMTDYGGYTLDFTGPFMLMVQRVTYIAFSYHDGLGREDKNLNEDQRKNKITKIPSLLEYLSYNFCFITILAGPTSSFNEYNQMISGDNFKQVKKPGGSDPSPLIPALKKFGLGILFLFLYTLLNNRIDIDKEILGEATPIFWRLFCTSVFCFFIRCRFYFVFMITESISNIAGLGFNGYNSQGKPRWDLVTTVDVIGFELGVNCRQQANAWNIGTQKWLRRIVYDRFTFSPVLMTFLFSAWWHGFYPSYYMSFLFLGLTTIASRKMRHLLWHRFQRPRIVKILYDISTTFAMNLCKDFAGMSFLVLSFERAFMLWRYYYFIPVIVTLGITLAISNKKTRIESRNGLANGVNGLDKSLDKKTQ